MERLHRRPTSCVAFACAFTVASIARFAVAGTLPIYGGATYDSATQAGIAPAYLYRAPGQTAGNGVGVAYGEKSSAGGTFLGDRAFRWDTSGAAATELGTLGTNSYGVTFTQAYAVNAAGTTTVGVAEKYDGDTRLGFRPVRWNAAGNVTELGTLDTVPAGEVNTYAVAVNASGVAAGYGDKTTSAGVLGTRAIRWNAGSTTATELGSLGTDYNGASEAQGLAINASGTVVGYSRKFDYSIGGLLGSRAVRWNAGGTVATELGNLGTNLNGAANDQAFAVNDSGTAVGYASTWKAGTNTSYGFRAVRWDAGGAAATQLGALGADASGFSSSGAAAVNASGTAVGYANKYAANGANLGQRAVRWNAGTTAAVELGLLGTEAGGVSDSQAYAINSSGVTVGYAKSYPSYDYHAVYWKSDGTAVDLNNAIAATGWTLYEADSISDAGWVSGSGSYDPDGSGPKAAYGRAFLALVPAAGTYGTGDADFDGKVTSDDLQVVQANYNKLNPTLAGNVGDFDLSGATNYADLMMVARHLDAASATAANSVAAAGGTAFAADWNRALSAVPEPTSLATLALLTLARRRRRRP